jgi:hypothetical protein
MEELKSLLKDLGIPPAAIAGVTIIAGIVIFFVKRALDLRGKRKAERRKTLSEYARLQEEALFKAYRKLYEDVNVTTLSTRDFLQVISETDELIMEPFTRYRNDLPADVQARIYDDIHNDLAQFKPDPTLPSEVTKEATHRLSAHRERFLQKIQSAAGLLRRFK